MCDQMLTLLIFFYCLHPPNPHFLVECGMRAQMTEPKKKKSHKQTNRNLRYCHRSLCQSSPRLNVSCAAVDIPQAMQSWVNKAWIGNTWPCSRHNNKGVICLDRRTDDWGSASVAGDTVVAVRTSRVSCCTPTNTWVNMNDKVMKHPFIWVKWNQFCSKKTLIS